MYKRNKMHMLRVIVVFILALGVGEIIYGSFTVEEGPYYLVMYNTSNCIKEESWFHTNVTVFNGWGKSVLRGSINIQKELKNVKFRIQIHYLDQGRIIKVFEIKNLNCHNTIIQIVLKALGLRYNQLKCTMKPTTTEFHNLQLNDVFHAVVHSLWYGTRKIRWEIAIPTTQLMCLDIYIQIVKASQRP